MNCIKRIGALILVLLILAGTAPAAMAAGDSQSAYPGDSITLEFPLDGIYSVDGTFTLTDLSGIVESIDYSIKERGGMEGGGISGDKCFLYDTANPAQPRNVVLSATLKLKAQAKVGGACSVTFQYNAAKDEGGLNVESGSQTRSVNIVTKPGTNAGTADPTEPTKGSNTGSNSGTNSGTNSNTNTSSGNKGNSGSTGNSTSNNSTSPTNATQAAVDYDKLNRQISIAQGLKEEDYDAAAWEVLDAALTKAKEATSSTSQEEVDAAANELSNAISTLAAVDHSKLREAIDKVSQQSTGAELSGLWYQMMDVLDNAEALLDSVDQAAVDAAVVQIEELLAEIQKAEADSAPGTIIEEVPVEVEPTDDYCNISMHKVWPILFFVSLTVNVVLIAVIVVYLVRRKRNQKDDTPLVDYDISDDEFDDLDDEMLAMGEE